jgi:hypothetical protein
MLYAGLDLSRKRVDFHLLDGDGATLEVGVAPPMQTASMDWPNVSLGTARRFAPRSSR